MADATLVTQEERRGVVHEMAPAEGLCRDCAQAEGCTFPRDPSRPIWSCDEFAGAELAPPRPKRAARPAVAEQTPDTAEFKGLCRGCANRLACSYPKPPGGIWHCDDLA